MAGIVLHVGVMPMKFREGQEIVFKSGRSVPERLNDWRAVILAIAPGGKLRITTGNEERVVHPEQVKRAQKA